VARRTVTKYRKAMNIPSSRQRRDWTAIAREPIKENGSPAEIKDNTPLEAPNAHLPASVQSTDGQSTDGQSTANGQPTPTNHPAPHIGDSPVHLS
jgi:hypothetical protein